VGVANKIFGKEIYTTDKIMEKYSTFFQKYERGSIERF